MTNISIYLSIYNYLNLSRWTADARRTLGNPEPSPKVALVCKYGMYVQERHTRAQSAHE
jgi:hypothetical protein